jgi:hypothetical protein
MLEGRHQSNIDFRLAVADNAPVAVLRPRAEYGSGFVSTGSLQICGEGQ